MWADAVRARPKLDVREHFPLDPLQIRQHGQENGSDQTRFDKTDDEEIIHWFTAQSHPNRRGGPGPFP